MISHCRLVSNCTACRPRLSPGSACVISRVNGSLLSPGSVCVISRVNGSLLSPGSVCVISRVNGSLLSPGSVCVISRVNGSLLSPCLSVNSPQSMDTWTSLSVG